MLTLTPEEAQVWIADLSVNDLSIEQQFTFLSPEEKTRANRLHFPHHRQRFITSHFILRRLLSAYLNVAPSDVFLQLNPHGKPMITDPNPSQLEFNMAHSQDVALYAFRHRHPIGIDLEKIQEAAKPDVLKRFFSASEQQAWHALPHDQQIMAFYRLWARKEAVIKALGKGLSYPLQDFSVAIDDRDERIDIDSTPWWLYPLHLHPDYAMAIATAQPLSRLRCFTWTGEGAIAEPKLCHEQTY